MEENEPQEITGTHDITGYRSLSDGEIRAINEVKILAEEVSRLITKLECYNIDERWIATGKTDLQKGFMSVIRSIARPTTF